jgi:hypothetical protein
MNDEKYAQIKARCEPLILPYRDSLLRQLTALAETSPLADVEIVVPRHWPANFDGSLVLGLPVSRGDVDAPAARKITPISTRHGA